MKEDTDRDPLLTGKMRGARGALGRTVRSRRSRPDALRRVPRPGSVGAIRKPSSITKSGSIKSRYQPWCIALLYSMIITFGVAIAMWAQANMFTGPTQSWGAIGIWWTDARIAIFLTSDIPPVHVRSGIVILAADDSLHLRCW